MPRSPSGPHVHSVTDIDGLDEVLAGLRADLELVSADLESVEATVSSQSQSLSVLLDRVGALEDRVAALETTPPPEPPPSDPEPPPPDPDPEPPGTLVYTAGFETGDFSELGPTPFSTSGNASGSISSAHVHSGTKSLALSVVNATAGTGVRARVDNNIIPGYAGGSNLPDHAVFGARFYIPEHVSMGNDDAWNIFQFKQTEMVNGSANRRNTFSVRPWERNGDRYGFVLKTRIDSNGNWANGNNIHLIENEQVTVTAGEWFQIQYEIDFVNGYHKVAIDGTVIGEVNHPAQVEAWEWGNWRRQWALNNYVNGNHTPDTHTLYVDDLTIHAV